MVINHDMFKTMPNEFIREGISSIVVLINQNFKEYEGFEENLNINNDEHDLYHVLGTAKIKNTGFSNGCIYTDVNEAR